MTTSHDLAAMTDEQFETYLLRQAIETQIKDMRASAERMAEVNETAAALMLRMNADRLEQSLNPTDVAPANE